MGADVSRQMGVNVGEGNCCSRMVNACVTWNEPTVVPVLWLAEPTVMPVLWLAAGKCTLQPHG
jgi:hypothetical protein